MAAVSEVKVLHDEHRMSLYTTTFTLAKESLGTTILFMPYAFVGGGWLATGLLIFFSGAITWGTYRLQLDVLDSREELQNESINIHSACHIFLGRTWRTATETIFFMFNFMGSASNNMILLQLLELLFQRAVGQSNAYLIALLLAIIQIPMSMCPSLDSFSLITKIGAVGDLLMFSLALLFSFMKIYFSDFEMATVPEATTFSQVFFFLGMVFYCYDFSSDIANIRAEMSQPRSAHLAMGFTIAYNGTMQLLVGALGAFAFGKGVHQNVLVSIVLFLYQLQNVSEIFPKVALFYNLLTVLSVLAVMFIDNYLTCDVVIQRILLVKDNAIARLRDFLPNLILKFLISFIVMTLQLITAIELQNLIKSLNLMGCFFVFYFAFLLTYMMFNKNLAYKSTRNKKIYAGAIFFVGLGVSIIGAYDNIFQN